MGLLLAPGTGRLAALTIVGVPLIIFLIVGFKTTSSGNGNSLNSGGVPGSGLYPLFSSTQSADGSDQSSPSPSPSPSASATATDSSSDNASASDSASDSASATDSATPIPTDSGPAAVVLQAYGYVNLREYQAAYDLGLDKSRETYAVFSYEYSGYSTIQPTIESVQGDVVTASLAITDNDGQTQTATGTYTVSGGVITADQVQ